MHDDALLIHIQDKVCTFILNRPHKCNALDGHLIQRLQEAFFQAGHDKNIQLVVLKGNGNHFCAGADLQWMHQLAQGSFEQSRDDARNLASLLLQMHSFAKPIVTLAQGGVLGGGLGLLACSDIIIAAKDASFAFSEVKMGLVPAVISPYVVPKMGESAARYYFLTGQRFDAQEAQRLGLVHRVVLPEELREAGLELIKTLLQNSADALLEVKHLLTMVMDREVSLELSERTAEIFAKMRLSPHGLEGLAAFMEKRKPSWS